MRKEEEDMELDDMKARWNEYDRRLEAAVRVNTRVARATLRAETALQRHARSVWFELAGNALVLLLLGSFIGDHFREPRFLVPALVLHAAAILLTGACIRQLVGLHGIDHAEAVVDIQKRVERLRIEWIRTTKWTFLCAPLLWVPLLIVMLKGLIGLDAWAAFDTPWLIANLLFGAALIPLMLWVSRRFAARMAGSPLLQRLMNDLAGHSLVSATRFLDDVASFERTDR